MGWKDKLFKGGQKQQADDGQAQQDQARVYDVASASMRTVPLAELEPSMIPAEVEGIAGTVWIDGRLVQPGQQRHPPFTEDVREQLRQIKSSLDDVYSLTLEEWEDGFRRDRSPEHEIAMWLHLAARWRALTSGRELSQAARRDYFKVLLACTNSPAGSSSAEILQQAQLQSITPAEARQVIEAFFQGQG